MSKYKRTLGLEDNTFTFGSGGLKLGILMVSRSSKHGLELEGTLTSWELLCINNNNNNNNFKNRVTARRGGLHFGVNSLARVDPSGI